MIIPRIVRRCSRSRFGVSIIPAFETNDVSVIGRKRESRSRILAQPSIFHGPECNSGRKELTRRVKRSGLDVGARSLSDWQETREAVGSGMRRMRMRNCTLTRVRGGRRKYFLITASSLAAPRAHLSCAVSPLAGSHRGARRVFSPVPRYFHNYIQCFSIRGYGNTRRTGGIKFLT